MKKLFFALFTLLLLACSNSDDGNQNLPNVTVNETVFLNNPTANDLLAPGGYITISGGISGIIVYNHNNSIYYAYDRACPDQAPNQCQPMVVKNGLTMQCPCDESEYALALGGQPQSGTRFAARQYKVVKNGETLIITNF